MIKLYEGGAYILDSKTILEESSEALGKVKEITGLSMTREEAKKGTIAYPIIESHNVSNDHEHLRLEFDSLTSHDITYVGIIQTARASGMEKFPMPYVLTNCHNTLCAVGGTINEDDHKFGLSAVKKYGGIYVPPHMAVIHSYNREMMAGCGRMILGSDSHTRYGALGTIAVGEGGGELVKQLVGSTYDVKRPETIAIYLTGKPSEFIGPHDVALQIIGKVFKNGYVKNKLMEFIGDGVSNLSVEFRNGIDVMTTETTCWSSIWRTDEKVKEYFDIHKRPEAYKELNPGKVAYYDGIVYVDLSEIKPSIAIPFHPSNVYTIEEFKKNTVEILVGIEEEAKKMYGERAKLDLQGKVVDGEFHVDQGIIAGCSGGTFDNVVAAADILEGKSTGNDKFTLSVYPGSQPEYKELVSNGTIGKLMDAGAIIRSAFCGPCFGAGDTPANNEFSIRHTTRNFPNREGSKPSDGQISAVALMDAKSIAATAANGGVLTGADEIEANYSNPEYNFNGDIYERRNYNGTKKFNKKNELAFGPNIKDWPEMEALKKHLLLKVVSYLTAEVTTTDELIPSGETSSFRSNPHILAEFTLSRTDPEYVEKAKEVRDLSEKFIAGEVTEIEEIIEKIKELESDITAGDISLGSTIFAKKPGDGSAREHAASCQKVLGAWANIANEYATKRYRSNLINWGMVPFIIDGEPGFEKGDYIFIPDAKDAVMTGMKKIKAYVIGETIKVIDLQLDNLTDDEKNIITDGSLINYHRNK